MSETISFVPEETQVEFNQLRGKWTVTMTVPQAERITGAMLHDLVDSIVSRQKQVVCDIKEFRRSRSLDANAYAWVLIGKLAAKLRIPKDDVYRAFVREVGNNYEPLYVAEDALEAFNRQWASKGVGWFIEQTGTVLKAGENTLVGLLAYYGSSSFDSLQMSQLIELIVQDCREQGIETMPPDKLKALLERWDNIA